jgi:RNA polymerase sigma-54 factor
LQQAIKLLPMTTLELAELLNQEMVENPLLEEVPTEEQTPEQAAAEAEKKAEPEKDKETWDDADYEYFFGEYLDEGLSPAAAAGSKGTAAD